MWKISIITVCYNAEQVIKQTISSVLEQSYHNFEYVVIDGKSTDDTMTIVSELQPKFINAGISMTVVSEKDSGIYNAMNKGIAKSRGEWLLFLNAGDYLCDSNVLKRIAPVLNKSEYDVVYGDTILKSNCMYKYDKSKPLTDIKNGMSFCHQSVFISRIVMSSFLYDERYNICADHNFFVRLYVEGFRFHSVDFPISVFLLGGVSTNLSSYQKRDLERIEIYYSNGLIDETEREKRIKLVKKESFKRGIKNKVKALIPSKIISYRMDRYYEKDGWSENFPIY